MRARYVGVCVGEAPITHTPHKRALCVACVPTHHPDYSLLGFRVSKQPLRGHLRYPSYNVCEDYSSSCVHIEYIRLGYACGERGRSRNPGLSLLDAHSWVAFGEYARATGLGSLRPGKTESQCRGSQPLSWVAFGEYARATVLGSLRRGKTESQSRGSQDVIMHQVWQGQHLWT